MCDYGRTMYEHLNVDERLAVPMAMGKQLSWQDISKQMVQKLSTFQAEK